VSPDALPSDPTETREEDSAAHDLALRRQLRALPSAAPAAELEALSRRVLAQWREQVAAPARHEAGVSTVLAAGQAGGRWLAMSAGLMLCAALAIGLWLQRGDPVLDELARPDVLSQMAAGEM
jgi:hypothetical protein